MLKSPIAKSIFSDFTSCSNLSQKFNIDDVMVIYVSAILNNFPGNDSMQMVSKETPQCFSSFNIVNLYGKLLELKTKL